MRWAGIRPNIKRTHLDRAQSAGLVGAVGREPDGPMRRHHPGPAPGRDLHSAGFGIEKLPSRMAVKVACISGGVGLRHGSYGARHMLKKLMIGTSFHRVSGLAQRMAEMK